MFRDRGDDVTPSRQSEGTRKFSFWIIPRFFKTWNSHAFNMGPTGFDWYSLWIGHAFLPGSSFPNSGLTAGNKNMSSYNLSCQNESRLIWLYLAPLRPSTSSCSTLNMDFLENVTTSLLVLQICTTSWSTDILKSVEIVFKSYDDSLRSYSPWSMPWLMEDAGMNLVGS